MIVSKDYHECTSGNEEGTHSKRQQVIPRYRGHPIIPNGQVASKVSPDGMLGLPSSQLCARRDVGGVEVWIFFV